jgi:hypothetical protein
MCRALISGAAAGALREPARNHGTHVLGKLGVANRTEAAARARQLGLIP